MSETKKRVFLVDDHPVLRKGLARLIDSKPGFSVCGEASTAVDAMTAIRDLKPHLVVVDEDKESRTCESELLTEVLHGSVDPFDV